MRLYLDKFFSNRIYLVLVTIVALYIMDFNQTQSVNWIAPYLSASSNYDFNSFKMYVDFNQIKDFALLSKDTQFSYTFPSSENVVLYDYLALGFLYIAIVSKTIFFFLGDLEAIQVIQCFVHISLSLLILNKFDKNYQKLLFFVLYMINPIILYFVNFPYYYFWQVVPSVIFLYYYLDNKKVGNLIFLVSIVFAFIYITRPTVLFFIIFIFIVYSYTESLKKGIIAGILFLSIISIIPKSGLGPWHTMFIGIGAYNNPYGIELSDESGYNYFYEKTGKVMNSTKIIDIELRNNYYSVLKDEYINIIQENKLLAIQNALKNILSSYSIGYQTNNTILIYISIFTGLIFICLLLYTKQYLIFLSILVSSISFSPYYPPIKAYMFGSYILIVIGLIGVIEFIRNRKKETIDER